GQDRGAEAGDRRRDLDRLRPGDPGQHLGNGADLRRCRGRGRRGTRDDDAHGPWLPGGAVAPGGSGIKSPQCCRRDRREGRCRVGTRVDEGSDVRGGEAAAGALVETCIPLVRRGQGSGGRAAALAEAEGGKMCTIPRLSKKADYALMAMKHLATRTDLASASAREIAEQYDIPVELMAKVLQRLARRGLLTSHQGTRGGYRLARGASAISVADIIQAIDGPLTVTACSTGDENCGQYAKCSVRDPLWRIKDRILAALATCSLQEVSADAAEAMPQVETSPVSFTRARTSP